MMFLIIPLLYLFAGTILSKRHYRKELELCKVHNESKGIVQHGRSCYLNPKGNYYNPNRSCDCGGGSGPQEMFPDNPYFMLLGWPILGFHQFLTAPKVDKSAKSRVDYELVQRLEKELDFPNT